MKRNLNRIRQKASPVSLNPQAETPNEAGVSGVSSIRDAVLALEPAVREAQGLIDLLGATAAFASTSDHDSRSLGLDGEGIAYLTSAVTARLIEAYFNVECATKCERPACKN